MTDEVEYPAGALEKWTTDQWKTIYASWESGYTLDTQVDRISRNLADRKAALSHGGMPPGFDWQLDLIKAELIHESYIDRVRNRRAYNDTLDARWQDWLKVGREYLTGISLEGLRSIVLIHGATILATLTVVSGQIAAPAPHVMIAAKTMFSFSVVGLAVGVAGYSLIYAILDQAVNSIDPRLIRPMKHERYRSLYRYRTRFFARKAKLPEFLIYASIGAFIIGSILSCMILVLS